VVKDDEILYKLQRRVGENDVEKDGDVICDIPKMNMSLAYTSACRHDPLLLVAFALVAFALGFGIYLLWYRVVSYILALLLFFSVS